MKNKSGLFSELKDAIAVLDVSHINEERKLVLQPLVHYVQSKIDVKKVVRLNFICTHNSRRSHLSQVWAQTMARYFRIGNVFCYSGGTEATAMFPMAVKTLKEVGFKIKTITHGQNPVYAIKFSENVHPIIGFSKTFDDDFNPKSNYAAIMTCSHANENCPFVPGAEKRIAITYEDPKAYDNTPQQIEKYQECSMQIATEMKYVFSRIK